MNKTQENTSSARAWSAYAIGTVFFFYAFVQRVSPSVMTSELMKEFSVGASGVGLLSGMYFYTYASIQLPVGLLVDRFGARRLLALSATLCAVASVGFAMSTELWQASIFRALIGGLVAFAFVGTLAIAAEFFDRKRFAMLTGFLMTTGMIGAIAGQAPLRLLVETYGWRNCFWLLSASALLLAIASYFVIPAVRNNSKGNNTGERVLTQIRHVIVNRQSVLCTIGGFGFAATMLSFAGLWAVPWLTTTKGYTQVDAGSIVSLLFAGVMVGSPLLGWLSDAMERRKPVLNTGIVLCLVTFLGIVHLEHNSSFTLGVLFFLNGLGTSSVVVLMGLSREWNKSAHSATTLGFVNMGVVGSGAVMQPVIGTMLDIKWTGELLNGARVYSSSSYDFAFQSLVGVLAIAVVCIFSIKESQCKQQIQ